MRIIPITIATALLFVAVKLIDISRGTEALSQGLLIGSVEAQQAGDSAAQKLPSADEVKAETAKEESKAEEKKPAEADSKEPAATEKTEEKKSEEAKPAEGDEKKEDEAANPAVSLTAGELTTRHFTGSELDLLQKLAGRRGELDRWERNIQIKEQVLNATEKRINDRIVQIEAMKQQVAELLALYNEKEDAKIRSLVKIYENMKPKEAARIFDEVEMPILLLVIDKMSEKKAAPILAQMEPKKAKQITVELAEQRRYSTAKINPGAAAPSAAPPVPAKPLPQ